MFNRKKAELFECVKNGDVEGVEELLQFSMFGLSPDVNVQDEFGGTLLYYGVWSKNPKVVELLLKKKADPNLETHDGTVPLMSAVNLARINIVRMLIEHGADVHRTDFNGKTPLACLPIFHSDTSAIFEIARCLIEHGANPNVKELEIPLLVKAIMVGDDEFARFLIEKNADIEAFDEKRKMTALSAAVNLKNSVLAQQLIQMGANVNAQDIDGTTPLMFAAYNGDMEMVKLLIQNGANIFDTDSDNGSLMLYAAGGGNLEIVQFLEEQGISLHNSDSRGTTPFIAAAHDNRKDVMVYLSGKGVDIDAQDEKGNTAFITAAQNNNPSALEFLAELGVDVTIKNKKGLSAFFVAIDKKNNEAMSFFQDSGLIQYRPDNFQRDRINAVQTELKKRTVEQLVQLPEKEPELWQKTIALRQLSVLIQLIPVEKCVTIYEKAQHLISVPERKVLQQIIREGRVRNKAS